ncbi:MAG TPA: PEP-CTERM sorting domain-containing protein [Sedimentisphaerales bacterium]|nr:PEP-CTERM sorting domain-containing protein [Sedimentisphaerales bacterium]
MITIRSYSISFIFLIAFLASDSEATLYFDDGEQHVVDYSVTGGVRVDWASPGRETELYVVHGAEIIDNHTGYGICVYENGIVSISGGFISQNVHSSEESTIFFSEGIIEGSLQASEHSEAYVSGGIIGRTLNAYGDGIVYLSGGKIGGIATFDNGKMFVTGGESGLDIVASHASTIVIYGTGFNYDYGDIGVSVGQLIGTLANGDRINNYFHINNDARIVLAIPEPVTLLLLGLGGLLLKKWN